MEKLKRLKFLLIRLTAILLFFLSFLHSASAADLTEDAACTLDKFMSEVAGRYFTVINDETVVLELIPSFGHLFGSVGYYMEGSLYSYYAAEFTPVCWLSDEKCTAQYSSRSMDFVVQLFSNMSYGGNYWEGLSQQRLTLLADDLLLSHYAGNGYGLITQDMILMVKSDKAPTLFPYNTDMAEGFLEKNRINQIPDFLTGSFRSSWIDDGVEFVQLISFDENGEMMLLRQTDDLEPPLLLKGGYALADKDDGSYDLCYLMSSPSSGTMPFSGCAAVRNHSGALIIEEFTDDWSQFLTGPAARQLYVYN